MSTITAARETTGTMQPTAMLSHLSAELQSLQRQRAIVLKSRNMQASRLRAIVAGTLGYHSGMPEKERTKKFSEATAIIEAIAAGKAEHPMSAIVLTTLIGINAFEAQKKALEKEMIKVAKQLPVAAWVKRPAQRGFGLLFLAIVIGETGDLSNYANPAKVWKRLGCAPHTFDGKTAMGATWRAGKEGKLPAMEWEAFGYSPRRRGIAYLIGDNIVKQNGRGGDKPSETESFSVAAADSNNGAVAVEKLSETEMFFGPYRARYDEAKLRAKEVHPDWSPLRCHRHAMLLATKLLLKNLWIEWNRPADEGM